MQAENSIAQIIRKKSFLTFEDVKNIQTISTLII
jgi:hypothetical protein